MFWSQHKTNLERSSEKKTNQFSDVAVFGDGLEDGFVDGEHRLQPEPERLKTGKNRLNYWSHSGKTSPPLFEASGRNSMILSQGTVKVSNLKMSVPSD